MVQSIFIRLVEGGGEEGSRNILCRSSSRGLGTPEVKIGSVPVPTFTGNKTALMLHCITSAKLYQNILNVILTSYNLTH